MYHDGTLDRDVSARLETYPKWAWDVIQAEFEEHYSALQDFVAREGHARVVLSHVEGDLRLGRWVAGKRSMYKNNRLAKDQVAKLEAIEGWLWRVTGRKSG